VVRGEGFLASSPLNLLIFDGKAKKEGGRSEMEGRTRWRLVGWSEKRKLWCAPFGSVSPL
jgi:hypothetical protein